MSVHAFDRGLDWHALAAAHGAPLLVLDCDVLRQQYRALSAALPGVAIHYAIKALPELAAISTLADEGACFEIASQGEIELLRSARESAFLGYPACAAASMKSGPKRFGQLKSKIGRASCRERVYLAV